MGTDNNVFNKIQVSPPSYSYFDLSHDHKTTLNMGILYPILTAEVLPGDKWQLSSTALFRMMPMIAPIMHNVGIFIHHFFVPNRIVFSEWERFIMPPDINSPAITHPVIDFESSDPLGAYEVGGLLDRLGFPPQSTTVFPGDYGRANALPLAAYQMIWYEYYRDQNVFDEHQSFQDFCGLRPGSQTYEKSVALTRLRYRAWEYDYFTACLPFAQKGEPVSLPIEVTTGGAVSLPVYLQSDGETRQLLKDLSGASYTTSGPLQANDGIDGPDNTDLNIDPNGTLNAEGTIELSETSTTTTINDLRAAYALQRWLEKNARGGTRYTEALLIHFNVRSSDARLQRPEYLGGSRSVMSISEVLQTSETTDTTPQGNMAGHGISTMSGNSCSYYAEEHGFIMSILSIRPRTAYAQGLPKMFMRRDRLDYYWPDFAFLGEAEVKNYEVFLQMTSPNQNDLPFGYLPRYSEYRYLPSRVSGAFHTYMKTWALHRLFENPPALDIPFIECHPSKRIFAIEDENIDSIVGHIYHQINVRRCLPKYGNPGGLI